MIRKFHRRRKGQALVEYAVIIAGVMLISLVGISLFGHKVAGMINMATVILPGVHASGNNPIQTGRLVEFSPSEGDGRISLAADQIEGNFGKQRFSMNIWGGAAGDGAGSVFTPGGHGPAAGGGEDD